jgi:hypothetical protein
MSFLPSTGFGAGEGADMLQSILRQKADEVFRNQQIQAEQQRIALASQEAQQRAELQRATLASMDADRKAKEQQMADVRGATAASLLPMGGMAIDPNNPAVPIVKGSVFSGILSPQGSLPSTAIGGVTNGQPMTRIARAGGTPTGFLQSAGTPQQQSEAESNSALTQAANDNPSVAQALKILRVIPEPDKRAAAIADVAKNLTLPTKSEGVFQQNTKTGAIERMVNGQWVPWQGDVPPGAHWMTAAQPPGPQYSVQGVTLPDGSGGLVRLDNRSGAVSPVTLPSGMTAGKPSAQMQVKAEDRKRAAAGLDQLDAAINNAQQFIGPGAGRVSTIEQMIGNPDPRVQALGTKMLMAKMTIDAGIGGARAAASPQLLQRWDNLFSQKLTPEALHSTVQAMREMLNAGQTAAPSSSSGFKVVEIK